MSILLAGSSVSYWSHDCDLIPTSQPLILLKQEGEAERSNVSSTHIPPIPRTSPLTPWYGTFANVPNGHGLCARTHVGRYDQKDSYTLIPGAAYYDFCCDAGETMPGGDATHQRRLARHLEQSACRLCPGHCTIPKEHGNPRHPAH